MTTTRKCQQTIRLFLLFISVVIFLGCAGGKQNPKNQTAAAAVATQFCKTCTCPEVSQIPQQGPPQGNKALAEAEKKKSSASKEDVPFEWPAKHWKKGRITKRGEKSVLEYKFKNKWIPLMNYPHQTEYASKSCKKFNVPTHPGIFFPGTPAFAVQFKSNSINGLKYDESKDCYKDWVMAKVNSLLGSIPVLEIRLTHIYTEPDEELKARVARGDGDFFPQPGIEQVIVKTDSVTILDAKKQVIWSQSLFHGTGTDCADVTVSIYKDEYGTQNFLKVVSDEFDCVNADSSSQEYLTQLFQTDNGKTFTLVAREASSDFEKDKWSGYSYGDSSTKEWFTETPYGKFIRREMKSEKEGEWRSPIYEDDERTKSLHCDGGLIPTVTESISESDHYVEWVFVSKDGTEITLDNTEIAPAISETEETVACGEE